MAAKHLQLDNTSLNILKNVADNGPRSTRKIADDLKISHQTVKSKLDQMEHKGVIRGYSASIDLNRLGYVVQNVYLKLGEYNTKKIEQVITLISTRPEVCYFSQMKGQYDFVIKVTGENLARTLEVEHSLREKVSNMVHIKLWDTALVLKEFKTKPSSKAFETETPKSKLDTLKEMAKIKKDVKR
ncbi:MAG: Lrp/AsnC family transcriptional regulator [Candidatus Diapherotrites archaeon]|nr:Lrp/AsnC family transcriptional regulator [Candidatus Diapherotrites archaeon]